MYKIDYLYIPFRKKIKMLSINDISIEYLKEGNKPLFKKLLTELSEANSSFFPNMDVDVMFDNISSHQKEHGLGLGCLINSYGKVVGLAGLCFLQATKLYETFCFISPNHVEEIGYSMIIDRLVNYAFDELNLDKVCARADIGVIENELYLANGFTYLGERIFEDNGNEKIWNYYEMDNDSQLISDNSSAEIDNDWDLSY